MNCPACQHPESKVLETRATGDALKRRRQCLQCNHRFTTHERVERKLPLVIKREGRREPFDHDKVVEGVRLACRKRPVDARTIDEVIAEVAAARVTERGTRADDKASEAAMEDRKKAGYF